VYSPHTAFDNTVGGINDRLAARIGLSDVKPLRVAKATQSNCKLVAFVPDADLAKVSDALFTAGAGQIGDYRECSFRVTGTGTFFGSDGTQPKVGQKGRREEVAEWRLEVVCPTARLAQIVSALRTAHSYEEPAYDIFPVLSMPANVGEGRLGTLRAPLSLSDFAGQVRVMLGCGPVQVVGDSTRMVSRVAVACGAAGEFLKDAQGARCDVLMTGEMRFHDYLAARTSGVALVLPGHYSTERFAVEELAEWLNDQVTGVQARVSRAERDPVTWN
jgi:dinuclear metal center YbgI/SA1388 family protein